MLSWTEKPSPSQKAGWANWHDSMGCQKKMNPYWPLAKRLAGECIWLMANRDSSRTPRLVRGCARAGQWIIPDDSHPFAWPSARVGHQRVGVRILVLFGGSRSSPRWFFGWPARGSTRQSTSGYFAVPRPIRPELPGGYSQECRLDHRSWPDLARFCSIFPRRFPLGKGDFESTPCLYR